jgi:shikimate kinase
MGSTRIETEERRHVVLVGAMGVGKSTIGRLLASEIGIPFLDSDEYLEATTGESGSDIAAREGVARLHELELEAFLAMCRTPRPAVIAPAASVVDDEAGRQALEESFTIWLTAPDHVLALRQARGTHRRPVARGERAALHQRRAPFLERVSDMKLDTATSTPAEVVAELMDRLPTSVRS